MKTNGTEKLSLSQFHIMYETDILNGHRPDFECPYDANLFNDEDQEDLKFYEKCLLYSKEKYEEEEGRGCYILIKKETCDKCGKKENPKNFEYFEGEIYCEQCQKEYIKTCDNCGDKYLKDEGCLCEAKEVI